MTPIAAMKSIPQTDGMIATKKSEFSKPGYVLELGGSEIGNGGVVLLTETTFWFYGDICSSMFFNTNLIYHRFVQTWTKY